MMEVEDVLSRYRCSEGYDYIILYEYDLDVNEVNIVPDISKEELRKYHL